MVIFIILTNFKPHRAIKLNLIMYTVGDKTGMKLIHLEKRHQCQDNKFNNSSKRWAEAQNNYNNLLSLPSKSASRKKSNTIIRGGDSVVTLEGSYKSNYMGTGKIEWAWEFKK